MADQLKASIVRIVGENNSIAGVGFLVSEKHVLTCAHVVAQALNIPQDTQDMPTDQVRLDFPFSELNETNTARVVFWKPVRSAVSGAPDRSEDIAALELEGNLPEGIHPGPIVTGDALRGHSFRTFGFPLSYDDGVWAYGVLRDSQSKGWVQIEGEKDIGYFVAPGFSGSPVWDDQAGGVVGMVVVADKRSDVRAAFMIPTATLIKAWPGLQAEIAQWKAPTGKPEQNITESRRRVGGRRINATSYFKTRDPQQKQVGEYLARPSTRVVSVTGRAGIGKTALASKVLNDLEQGHWPHTENEIPVDGIVYLSTRGGDEITLGQLFRSCGEMLGGEHKELLEKIWENSRVKTKDKVQRLLEELESGLYVILLDHVEDLLEEGNFKDAELKTFFESSLNASHSARLIVTSRDPLKFPIEYNAYNLKVPLLEGLPVADGIAMLRDLDPSGEALLRNADDAQLARAVQRVHGVPRALEVLAGIMQDKKLTTLDKILEQFYKQKNVVNLLIKEGYNRLDGHAQNVMGALAVFGCPVPPGAVEYLLKPLARDIDVTAVLERLLSIYMAKASDDRETVWLDPIDQEYAYSELPEQGDYSRTTLERLAGDYYKDCRKPRESWRTIDDVKPQLREFEHRVKAEDYEQAAKALGEIDVDFLIWHGHAQRALDLRSKLEGKLTDRRLQMLHAYALGNIREVLGPFNEAIKCFEQAREIAREIGDKEIECHATGSLGETCRRLGQLDKAIEHLQQSEAMARELNDVKKESWHLLSLGLACIYLGDIKAGINHANRLMEISSAADDKMSEAQAYDCFSLAYLVLGRMDETIRYSDKAVAIYKEVNDRNGSMYVLNVRGMAYIGLDQLSEAIDTLQQARKMAHDDSYARLEGFCLFNLACAYRKRDEMDNALKEVSEASRLLAEIQAAEGSAASALVAAIRAANEGRRLDEARALLDCARHSMSAPDIYDSDYFAGEARKIAQEEGWADLIASAERIIEESKRKLILPD
ncbi:MAG: tetratricopeptide repeat protein [Acidobacteriota bacterium]